MLLTLGLVFTALAGIVYLGGQIDLSFMENEARRSRPAVRNVKAKTEDESVLFEKADDKDNEGGDGSDGSINFKGATSLKTNLVAPSPPQESD